MSEFLAPLAQITTVLGSAALIALCGAVIGALSMLMYGRISPQVRLTELRSRANAARAELTRFDGTDVRIVWSLTRRAVGLSLRQIGLILGPTLITVVLVLCAAWLVDVVFHPSRISLVPWGPAWLSSGHAAFWLPLCAAALSIKWRFKIN